MTDDLPDHTNYSLIKAVDESGNLVTVLADSSGRIVSVMKGDYAGTMKTLAVDSAGRMISVIRDPTNDNYIAVDSNGNIVSVMKGDYAGTMKTLAVDSAGRMISVIRDPTNDNYIAVDSNGNIVAVMKGDYAGTMKTLAVDSQGRIQAVLTDPEDVFGNPNYIGAGELAVRLGSIKYYEMRGNVIILDDFENATLKWATSTYATGSSAARSNTKALSGNYSMLLHTAADGIAFAMMYRDFAPLPLSKVGFELSFNRNYTQDEIKIMLDYYDGTTDWFGRVDLDFDSDEVQLYTDTAHPMTYLSSWDLYQSATMWHIIKIVVDFSTKKYVRLLIDENENDLSSYSLDSFASTDLKHLYFEVRNQNHNANENDLYVDNFIITQNEP